MTPQQIDAMKLALEAQSSIESIKYWANAYSNPESGPHFHGHGMVSRLLTEYANLVEALAQPEHDTESHYKGVIGNVQKLFNDKREAQPEQEPVATLDDLEQEIYENTRQFVSRDVMEWMLKRYYTTPPQNVIDKSVAKRIATTLGWTPQRKPLTDEEITKHFQEQIDTGSLLSFADGVRFAEAAHGIKETK